MRTLFTGNIAVTGSYRKGKAILPFGDTVIKHGDEIAIICDSDDTLSVFNVTGSPVVSKKISRVILVGGTRVTRALITRLTPAEKNVITLIE